MVCLPLHHSCWDNDGDDVVNTISKWYFSLDIWTDLCLGVSFYCTIRHNRHIFIRMLMAMGARQCVRYCRLQLALCQIYMKLPYNKKHHTKSHHTQTPYSSKQSVGGKNTAAKRSMWNTIKMAYKTLDLVHPIFFHFPLFHWKWSAMPWLCLYMQAMSGIPRKFGNNKDGKKLYKYIWESWG